MLHQLHQTYLLLGAPSRRARRAPARAAGWVTLRRRLRGLLRAPA